MSLTGGHPTQRNSKQSTKSNQNMIPKMDILLFFILILFREGIV